MSKLYADLRLRCVVAPQLRTTYVRERPRRRTLPAAVVLASFEAAGPQNETMPSSTGAGTNVSKKELEALLVESTDLRDLERRLGRFNLFRVLRFETGELRHSNVLAWLLSPDETHGFGDRFLRRWLMRVVHDGGIETTVGVAAIDSAYFRTVDVLREWGQIDVLVRITLDHGEEWVVVIENKIGAQQGKGQLEGYRKRISATFPNAQRLFVFLTMAEEEPADVGWIGADYAQVRDVLAEALDENREAIGAEPLVLMNHYLRTIRELSMPDEDLIDLAARIYSRHRRALDFIFENRLDELAKLTEGVDRRMREASTSIGIAPLNMHKGYVRFLPSKWDTPNNRAGAAWGAGGSAYVICELNLWNKQPTVKIVEGSAPAAWREQLFVLAKSPPLRAAAKMSAQWMSIYRGKLPKLNPDVDPDEAAEAVWKACAEHVTNDPGFDAAVDIVAKHVALLPSP